MNSLQLQDWLQREIISQGVHGRVVALNQLPFQIQHRPAVYIVNSQPNSKPGKHWFVIYFPRVGPAEFFDSLGHGPGYYSWRLNRYLQKHGVYYMRNPSRVQQVGTKNCGQYCIYYIYQRCLGRCMKDIMSDFDMKDLNYNEDVIQRFCVQWSLEEEMDQLVLE